MTRHKKIGLSPKKYLNKQRDPEKSIQPIQAYNKFASMQNTTKNILDIEMYFGDMFFF